MVDDSCRHCGCSDVVPVIDKRIERSPKAGNRFRTACLGCKRWLPMTSEDEYKQHSSPHVLPADDAPPLGDDHPDPDVEDVVPLEDYDYGPEWADLVEKVTGERPDRADAATDGGQVPETDDEQDGEEDEEEEINRFECPAHNCDAVHEGRPDECEDPVEGEGCGVGYNW